MSAEILPRVEIAFTGGLTPVDADYTDVTDYLVSGGTRRGRQKELATIEAGTADVELENHDGRFDPLNAASPYSPGVDVFRPIRISGILADGTVRRVFSGYVEAWPQKWGPAGRNGTVSVPCVDGSLVLEGYVFGNTYTEQVVADGVRYYFRLNTVASMTPNATGLPDEGGFAVVYADGNPVGVPVSGLVIGSGDQALTYAAVRGGVARLNAVNTPLGSNNNPSINSPADFSVEVIARPNTVPTTVVAAYPWSSTVTDQAGALRAYIGMQFGATAGAARYIFAVTGTSGTPSTITGSAAVIPTAGRADHLVLRRIGSTVTAFANGVNLGTVALSTSVALSGGNTVLLGDMGTTSQPFTMTVDEFAVYPSVGLTDAQVLDHYTRMSMRREFESMTASARITAVLDAAGWPATLRDLASGGVSLSATGPVKGRTALALVQEAATAELGAVFLDGQGRVTFRTRPLSGAAAVVTLGDGPTETNYTADVTVQYSESEVVNDVTVVQANVTPMVSARSEDAASIAKYFRRIKTYTFPLSLAADVTTTAAALLARYRKPFARVPQVSLDCWTQADAADKATSLEVGAVAAFRRRPDDCTPLAFTTIVEGVAHDFSATSWRSTLFLSPAPE